MTIDDAVKLAGIIAGVVGLLTFGKAIIEFSRGNRLKRADYFYSLRDRIYGDEKFREIADLLDSDDKKLSSIPLKERMEFLGLYEEIALAVNSGIVRENVAYYMFGYYAIRCWRSRNFWFQINRDSIYWSLFKYFALRMEEIERMQPGRPGDLAF